MKPKIKSIAKPIIAMCMIFGLIQINTKVQAVTAYNCRYTGSYYNGCSHGGYNVIRCAYGYTSCAYYPPLQLN